jgi:GNAT superfamily N-acetyltransferase
VIDAVDEPVPESAAPDPRARAAAVRFSEVEPTSPPAHAALQQYFDELDRRFPTGFAASTGGGDNDAVALTAPHGAFVLLHDGDDVIGCGGVQRFDDQTAEVKRMWVHTEWRGCGLGRRMLEHLEAIARRQGRSRVLLDTNATLTEAIAMYERAGYRAVDRYNDNPYAQCWFEKLL